MDGIVCINKPSGPTSHDIVSQIRRIYGQKRVGHTGTLDPMATGVLVVCLGKATRVVEYLTGLPKVYKAKITLGQTTDSQDSTGVVLEEKDASFVTLDALKSACEKFTGEIFQVPPMISAIKVKGKPLYAYAREGKTLEREPRKITIYSIEVTGFTPGMHAEAELTVACSSGTYIRTLCADIGDDLGCGGIMSALDRISIGSMLIENSVTIDDLRESDDIKSYIIDTIDMLDFMPKVMISEIDAVHIMHGRMVEADNETQTASPVKLVLNDNTLLGIGEVFIEDDKKLIKPNKVFAEM